ncbi:MAG TPA: tetratricopeptide repeat protein [Gaiellaceae bacterium]|nr:tetratricopeptide repeat protein [Gaiellaceae bacterium]
MNTAHIDELDRHEMRDGFVWRPVRRHFDIKAFGVNAYTPGATKQIVEEHTESELGHEEIYLVLRGRIRFTAGDDEHELSQGQLIFMRDPSLKRGAVALTDDAAVLAVGGKPGEAYEVSAWETWFVAAPLVQAEKWDEVIALHNEALAQRPDHAPLLYNLACTEARAGKSADAKTHLKRAIELEPKWAEYAVKDADFASISADPDFPAA